MKLLLLFTLAFGVNVASFETSSSPIESRNGSSQVVTVIFNPPKVYQLEENSQINVELHVNEVFQDRDVFAISSDPFIAEVDYKPLEFTSQDDMEWISSFNVTGKFLGYTHIFLRSAPKTEHNNDLANRSMTLKDTTHLPVSVIRTPTVWDRLFVISVAVLVSLIYVNFGCALNWPVLKETIKRPIGPAIGVAAQFVIMPLISFAIARILFPGQIAMQLGMFFTGCVPGGGASNMWTVVLGGNLDLSITMTTISTFASFAMIPVWVFTLGKTIFEEGNLGVPYGKIFTVAMGLLIPLLVGTGIQYFLPKLSNLLVRVMKNFAIFLIIFIIIFGTVTNLYIFSLLHSKIAIGAFFVPFLGYIFGAILAKVFQQKAKDIIAISVETGVQNTGISIYLLRFALEQPEADIAQVCPVAVALMTPIPLFIIAMVFKCIKYNAHKSKSLESLPGTGLSTPALEQPPLIDH